MNLPSLTPANVATIAGVVVSAVLAVLTAFNVFHFNPQQQTAVIDLCVFGAGTGALIFAWLHTWASDTYDVGQVTAGLVSATTVVLGFLSAFGFFHASAEQQASLTAICGVLALAGAYVFSALHTRKVVMARRALARNADSGYGQSNAKAPLRSGR